LEQITALDEAIFGTEKKDSTGEDLKWSMISADNYMVRTLKQSVVGLAKALEVQVKQTEKDIRKAQKVFYGR
jgi:hypothetical protein